MYIFEEAHARLLEATGGKTQTALARDMGISQPSVHHALKNGRIPAGWLLHVLDTYGVNPAWVLYGGEHKKFMVPSDEKPVTQEVANEPA